jgi:hypothetical protein
MIKYSNKSFVTIAVQKLQIGSSPYLVQLSLCDRFSLLPLPITLGSSSHTLGAAGGKKATALGKGISNPSIQSTASTVIGKKEEEKVSGSGLTSVFKGFKAW